MKKTIFKFEPGDVVNLRSSDQLMTVKFRLTKSINTADTLSVTRYACVWFDYMGHLQDGVFRAEVLIKH